MKRSKGIICIMALLVVIVFVVAPLEVQAQGYFGERPPPPSQYQDDRPQSSEQENDLESDEKMGVFNRFF